MSKLFLYEMTSWKYTGSFEHFYKRALNKNNEFKNTGKQTKQAFIIKDGFRIFTDGIAHVDTGHKLSIQDWNKIINLLITGQIIRQEDSNSPRYNGKPIIYCLSDSTNLYGICVEYFDKKLPIITSAFIGTEKEIENWFNRNSANKKAKTKRVSQGDGNIPSVTTEGLLLGRDSNNIITSNNKKVNPFYEEKTMQVWHGTNNKFDKFDLQYFSRGDYGYGIYFTFNKALAKDYGKYLIKAEIPNSEYFLDFELPVRAQGQYIEQCFDKLVDKFEVEEIQDRICDVWNDGRTGHVLYSLIWDLCDGEKAGTELLYECGFKGTYSFNGDCYVCFSPKDVKILDTIQESIFKSLNNKIQRFI